MVQYDSPRGLMQVDDLKKPKVYPNNDEREIKKEDESSHDISSSSSFESS